MTDGILLHVEGGLARVTFDRPTSLNAMDFPMAPAAGARSRTRSRPTPRSPR